MSALEEVHWIALYRTESFAPERVDVGLAQIAQILYNTNVKKENAKKITDFLPFYRKKPTKDPDINTSVRNLFGKFTNRKE